MTTKVLTGSYGSGYYVSSPITTLSIAPGGYVAGGDAVLSGTLGAYAIINSGDIRGYDIGVRLRAGGTVTNFTTLSTTTQAFVNAAAVFVEGAAGLVINGSSNDTGALIEGNQGVAFEGAPGNINNFGRILGTGPSDSPAIYINDGLVLTNGSYSDHQALISGDQAIWVRGGAATMTNFGSVISTSSYDGATVSYTGGSFTNGAATDTTALVSGYGGILFGAAATIRNFGTILGSAASNNGIALDGGGTVTNGSATDTVALIEGGTGVYAFVVGTVNNSATIEAVGGAGAFGVKLHAGGSVTNGASNNRLARIQGYGGVQLNNGGLVSNFGTIRGLGEGSAGVGVTLHTNAILVNGSASDVSASVYGDYGVIANANSTVTNFATVGGASGIAFQGDATSTLVVEAGSTFIGSILGGGGTLELGSGTGTLAGLLAGGSVTLSGSMATTTFNNFATVQIDAPASFALAGTGGTIGFAQALTVFGTLGGTGTLALAGGTATFGTGADLTIAKVTEAAGSTAIFVAALLTVADVWTQAGGTVTVATGDRVNFAVAGDSFAGTLAGAGIVGFTAGTDALTGTTLSASNVVVNGAAVTLSGAINLSKQLTVTSPTLTVAAAGATLAGGGLVFLNGLATAAIIGASAATVLTNKETIEGTGQLGDSQLTLVNAAGATINGELTTALTINTGSGIFSNAGLVESTNTGGLTVSGAIANTGTLQATKGTLTVDGAVTGAGMVKIGGGVADFGDTFSENVTFTGSTGVLELTHSTTYTGQITGLSTSAGGSTLDLLDIGFTSGTTKATFSGTATSGTLTVTDGTHTAKITLIGNYVGHTFTTASDGHGGTTVSDPVVSGTGHVAPLVSALASFGAARGSGTAVGTPDHRSPYGILAAPS